MIRLLAIVGALHLATTTLTIGVALFTDQAHACGQDRLFATVRAYRHGFTGTEPRDLFPELSIEQLRLTQRVICDALATRKD
ncbi:hypothetical protein K7H20_22475 [Salipiger manganoxidans]|uniref:hypothetical protein n=1 Tax=Salipiger marinus TaxID=555512 RepID=UPI001E541673|nr:hypothetical protein [Salipiger manganoxidans]MCD1620828.1 hypothetical protein [Salipiger manganoxidans]